MDNASHPHCGSTMTAAPNIAAHAFFREGSPLAADVALKANHIGAGRLKSFRKPNDQSFARTQSLAKGQPKW